MTYATKMMDWGDENLGYQQQRGQHGEGLTVTHNLVRFLPLPDGALEVNFGSTVHFCGGAVVQRSDGELVLSPADRADLIAALYPIGGPLVSVQMFDDMKVRAERAEGYLAQQNPVGWIKSSELEFCRPRGVSVNLWLKPHEHLDVALYAAPVRPINWDDDLVRKMTEVGVTLRQAPDIAQVAADAQRSIEAVTEGILSPSKNSLFRSGVKIAAAEIADRATIPGSDGQRMWRLPEFPEPSEGVADLSRKLQQADQLRQILDTRPGPEADLATFQNWTRVAGKLLEELK